MAEIKTEIKLRPYKNNLGYWGEVHMPSVDVADMFMTILGKSGEILIKNFIEDNLITKKSATRKDH